MSDKKRIAAAIAVGVLGVSLAGCSAASTASQQASIAADNFETVRELTVYDTVTGQILFDMQGLMSISVDSGDSQLEVIIKDGDSYKKHFVGLNETTTYTLTDIDGVDVEHFRYKINVNPDMLIPFEGKIVNGGEK